MIIVLSILAYLALAFFSYRLYTVTSGFVRKIFWPFLIAKLLSCLLVGVLYTYYYDGGDYVMVMRDVNFLSDLARTDFFEYLQLVFSGEAKVAIQEGLFYSYEPRTFYFVRALSIVSWFGFSSFWGISCLLSMASALTVVLL